MTTGFFSEGQQYDDGMGDLGLVMDFMRYDMTDMCYGMIGIGYTWGILGNGYCMSWNWDGMGRDMEWNMGELGVGYLGGTWTRWIL